MANTQDFNGKWALAPVTSAHLPLKSCVFAIAGPS
jgi:hypothetical protein